MASELIGAGYAPAAESTRESRLFRAVATVGFAGLLVKIVSACKEMVVAGIYGRSDAMDAFVVAFAIPNLLVNLFAESMNQALIPTLVRVRLQDGLEKAQRVLSNVLVGTTVLLLAASAAMATAAHVLFAMIGSGFSPTKLALSVALFYSLLPAALLMGLAGNCSAVLNATGRFGIPAWATAAVPLCVMAGALAGQRSMGIWALALSTAVGAVLQLSVVARQMRAAGYPLRWRWSGFDQPTREIGGQYGPVVLSCFLASGGLLVDQGIAAALPPGSVSALAFAGRFVTVAVALFAGPISTALAPHFSVLVARRDWSQCRRTMRAWSSRTLLIAVPLAGAMMAGARLLVRCTLQHGHFGPGDTAIVAQTMAMYALQIPFFAVSRVHYRFVIAMRRTDLVLACGAINLVLDVVLDLVLMRRFGVAGLALATSLWTVSTWLFLRICAQRLLAAAERSCSIAYEEAARGEA